MDESSWGLQVGTRQETGREDEDPIIAMEYSYLKLDGTEDDDDEDDEHTQNKLLMLVAQDVQTTGTYVATCLRGKGVSEYGTQ